MAITIEVRTESKLRVATSPHPYLLWQHARDLDGFPMLSSVDPYGDTIFNRQQVERVVEELATLSSGELSAAERSSLVELRGLCDETLLRPHRYLWFVGA